MITKLNKIPDAAIVFLVALIFVSLSLYPQLDKGLSMSDEGFLWYGAVQTLEGEVPVRDFQSYDPGRYYWCALWMLFLDKGLISLRIAAGAFQVIGLWLGLLVIWRAFQSWGLVILSCLVLLLWMIPIHKLFEPSLAMAAVYFAYCLIKNPSLRQHFISGVFLGIAAFFGCNHGLYNFAAFFMLILFVWFKLDRFQLRRRMWLFGAGIIAGYSPMLIMIVVVPGFLEALLEGLASTISHGSTNLPLPVPWPWKIDPVGMRFWQYEERLLVGIFFVLLPLFHGVNFLFLPFIKKKDIQPKAIIIAK